jgi:O-antigen/teichoic acid export membrane protein
VTGEVKESFQSLIKGAGWTVGAYGLGQLVRLVSSIALTRLLTPELFGIMTIVNSVRTGIDLISDVGIAQSIVQNPDAEDRKYYSTAWSLKVVRGFVLWFIAALAGGVCARFFDSPILATVLPVAALYFIFDGFSSVSLFLMQKRLQVAELNLIGLLFEIIPGAALVILAYLFRSIWSLVFGLLIAYAAKTVISFFLLTDVRERFYICQKYMWQIIHFGKWIFLSSAIFFLSSNFDRLYLAKVAPLGLLGIFGIARSLSDMIVALVGRLCGLIVFPYFASVADRPRQQLHERIRQTRLHLLFLTAVGLSAFAAIADIPVKIIYDQRYHAAAGMLPFMVLGAWFSILCNINESTLMGFARPQYGAVGNGLKFIWLLIGLPFGYGSYGFLGVIFVVAASDIFRYAPIYIGQIRTRFAFGTQDALITLVMVALFVFFVWLRWTLGLGLAFHSPVE